MEDITRKTHEKHIQVLLEDSSFLVRCKNHPTLCPCYSTKKPCHDIPPEQLNCHYCLCPLYGASRPQGGCKINSKYGKWYENDNLSTGKIWDCSDCDYPHRLENARSLLKAERGL